LLLQDVAQAARNRPRRRSSGVKYARFAYDARRRATEHARRSAGDAKGESVSSQAARARRERRGWGAPSPWTFPEQAAVANFIPTTFHPGAIMPAAPGKKAVRKAAPKAASPKKTEKKSAPKRSPSGSKPGVGDKAPVFRLQDETGATRSLKDFAGKALVLYFYPKDDTPGCTQESCDFRDNLNRLTSSGAAVAGLSADSVESHAKFKKKHGLNFPLLSDPGRAALEAYGVWQEKSLYGRKFMGIVRSTFVIDGKGVIRAAFPKVSVTGHVDEVIAAVREIA
jgi:peroxiredoxin Q/BCP